MNTFLPIKWANILKNKNQWWERGTGVNHISGCHFGICSKKH